MISVEVIGRASSCAMLKIKVFFVEITVASASYGNGNRERPSALACSSVGLNWISYW